MTIDIRNVCKSYKDVNAVQNINLLVESGESVALLGLPPVAETKGQGELAPTFPGTRIGRGRARGSRAR